MSSGIPPHICSVCYFSYSYNKSPLILPSCGHTYCDKCIEIIKSNNEIKCPECKQVSFLYDNDVKSLPKNRALLDMIIYSETEKRKEIDNSLGKDEKTVKLKMLVKEYEESIVNIEKTYNKLIKDNEYIIDICDYMIIKDIDDVLDGIIDIVNTYRRHLHDKVRMEFEKVNLIRGFKENINMFKKYIDIVKSKHERENECEIKKGFEFEDVIVNINQIFDRIYKENKENVTEESGNNDDFYVDERNESEERKESENQIKTRRIKSKSYTNSYSCIENIEYIKKNDNQTKHVQDRSKELIKDKEIDGEISKLKSELNLIKLFSLTLNKYSKELYNPIGYFYINKHQKESLILEIKSLLPMIIDFDERIFSYNIEEISSHHSHKRLIKILTDVFSSSNIEKIKYVTSHFKLNPNFIYSDSIDSISYSNSGISSNNPNSIGSIDIYSSSYNLYRPIRGGNNNLHGNLYRSLNLQYPNISISSLKDKIITMNSLIKSIGDKSNQKEIIKYMIEHMKYIPFQIDYSNNSIDIKFEKEYEWVIGIGVN